MSRATSHVERALITLVVIAIVVAGTWIIDRQIAANLGRDSGCETSTTC